MSVIVFIVLETLHGVWFQTPLCRIGGPQDAKFWHNALDLFGDNLKARVYTELNRMFEFGSHPLDGQRVVMLKEALKQNTGMMGVLMNGLLKHCEKHASAFGLKDIIQPNFALVLVNDYEVSLNPTSDRMHVNAYEKVTKAFKALYKTVPEFIPFTQLEAALDANLTSEFPDAATRKSEVDLAYKFAEELALKARKLFHMGMQYHIIALDNDKIVKKSDITLESQTKSDKKFDPCVPKIDMHFIKVTAPSDLMDGHFTGIEARGSRVSDLILIPDHDHLICYPWRHTLCSVELTNEAITIIFDRTTVNPYREVPGMLTFAYKYLMLCTGRVSDELCVRAGSPFVLTTAPADINECIKHSFQLSINHSSFFRPGGHGKRGRGLYSP